MMIRFSSNGFRVSAAARKEEAESNDEKNKKEKSKQSLFGSVTEALDFSQVRSEKDADLLEDAREATRSGGKMSKEQVNSCLRA